MKAFNNFGNDHESVHHCHTFYFSHSSRMHPPSNKLMHALTVWLVCIVLPATAIDNCLHVSVEFPTVCDLCREVSRFAKNSSA